jgi:hypothetical protein
MMVHLTQDEKVEQAMEWLLVHEVTAPTTVFTFDALEPGGPPVKVRIPLRYDREEARSILEKSLLPSQQTPPNAIIYHGDVPEDA